GVHVERLVVDVREVVDARGAGSSSTGCCRPTVATPRETNGHGVAHGHEPFRPAGRTAFMHAVLRAVYRLASPLHQSLVRFPKTGSEELSMTFDANPHTETRTARAGRNTLNVYLDDAGAFDLMSAEEERFVARQIAELRRDYWRALLSSPTLVEPVLEAACRVLGKDALANERLERVREALRLFTDGKDAEHAHALAAELEQVAIHLGGLDCDRVAAEAIAEDIERLMPDDPDRQERTKHLRLRTMPSPAAMEAYRSRVRRARGRLQAARNR